MKKVIVALDIDNCICNTTEAVLSVYNEEWNDNLSVDDIKTYWIENYVKPEAKESFHKYFLSRDMWKRVKPINIEAIQKLIDDNRFEVYFVTATSAENCAKKISFLSKHLKNIDISDRFIRTTHKELINADVLIDDCTDNLNSDYSKINLCLAYPWNTDFSGRRFGFMSDIVEWLQRRVFLHQYSGCYVIWDNK